jgi:hypothetical protein
MVFRTSNNYRVEALSFDIVPFRNGDHALLGRSLFTKFHTMPHYAYMKLKMPGPNDMITVDGDPDRSFNAKDRTTALVIETESEA